MLIEPYTHTGRHKTRFVHLSLNSVQWLMIPTVAMEFITTLPFVLVTLSLAIVFQLGRTWWRLRHIPGPFPACITNFQRMSWIGTKRAHLILQDVHTKYGEVVRIGPNMVSFSNPEAIPTVYPTRAGFPKVCSYQHYPRYRLTRMENTYEVVQWHSG
jgi:hypothetical protein